MLSIFKNICDLIRTIIDYFYPPFSKYVSLRLFRYGITGGLNLVFDWFLYFIIYNFILQHQMLNLGFITLSSHIASMLVKFPIVIVTGFLMQKYVTFSYSELRGRVQLFRYIVVFFINLTINYIGLKLLVDYFHIYPTPSNMIISVFTIVVSYFSQKHYTFKIINIPQITD